MKSTYSFAIVVFVVFILFPSCNDQEPAPNPPDRGSIIGRDFALGACCGGWFIDINEERYRFMEIPAATDIDLINSEFPIEVLVEWSPQQNACLGNEIDVISMERTN